MEEEFEEFVERGTSHNRWSAGGDDRRAVLKLLPVEGDQAIFQLVGQRNIDGVTAAQAMVGGDGRGAMSGRRVAKPAAEGSGHLGQQNSRRSDWLPGRLGLLKPGPYESVALGPVRSVGSIECYSAAR
jgi:hypothetical protein